MMQGCLLSSKGIPLKLHIVGHRPILHRCMLSCLLLAWGGADIRLPRLDRAGEGVQGGHLPLWHVGMPRLVPALCGRQGVQHGEGRVGLPSPTLPPPPIGAVRRSKHDGAGQERHASIWEGVDICRSINCRCWSMSWQVWRASGQVHRQLLFPFIYKIFTLLSWGPDLCMI
jgi:hypothetical protein